MHTNETGKPRCYIAGKIGDLPEEEYKANFAQAKKEVAMLGYIPVSPVDLPHNHGKSWADYMREDLREMLTCQYLYAQRNWRHSPGAQIEVQLALQLGLNIIHQPEAGVRAETSDLLRLNVYEFEVQKTGGTFTSLYIETYNEAEACASISGDPKIITWKLININGKPATNHGKIHSR